MLQGIGKISELKYRNVIYFFFVFVYIQKAGNAMQ